MAAMALAYTIVSCIACKELISHCDCLNHSMEPPTNLPLRPTSIKELLILNN